MTKTQQTQTTCRSCSAPIIFATIKRRWNGPESVMPLDAEPIEDGEWLLDTETERATYVGKAPSLIPDNRHRTHRRNCGKKNS